MGARGTQTYLTRCTRLSFLDRRKLHRRAVSDVPVVVGGRLRSQAGEGTSSSCVVHGTPILCRAGRPAGRPDSVPGD